MSLNVNYMTWAQPLVKMLLLAIARHRILVAAFRYTLEIVKPVSFRIQGRTN